MKAGVPCVLLLIAMTVLARGEVKSATIVSEDVATEVNDASSAAGQLWITTADLSRAAHFEVKPQGVCRAELCFPLPKARKGEFLERRDGKEYFNLAAFARLVHQPFAHQAVPDVWYFGLRPDQQTQLISLDAPDFTLPDINGKPHSLSDFRGKKVLLLTWASW